MSGTPSSTTVGFGCLWNRWRPRTWSHIPQSLMTALEATGPVVDLGYDAPLGGRLFWLRHMRRVHGRFRSGWRYQEGPLDAAARAVAAQAERLKPDVIITVPDIGSFDRPFFIYQDLSYDLVLREVRAANHAARANFDVVTIDEIERLAERQRAIFERASGIMAMSEWYARSLVEDSGLDPNRVHVVRPGASAASSAPLVEPDAREGLLFVGRDFHRKGGGLLVEAVRSLRRQGSDVRVTIVGPEDRPPSVGEEDWIDFRGPESTTVVAELMRTHAAFVMPTHFEAYGIVFHEALRAGTPVVGPNAYAVPEIVTDGVDGVLFDSWSVDAVAGAIDRVLTDQIREGAFKAAPAQADTLTWERAAREARGIVAAAIA